MWSVSSRILTQVTVSIFYDDNHYTIDTIQSISDAVVIIVGNGHDSLSSNLEHSTNSFVKRYEHYYSPSRGCPRGVMVKAMDCGILVSEFELQLHYYVHFQVNTLGKRMNPLILPAMGLIVPLLFFLENGFGIK